MRENQILGPRDFAGLLDGVFPGQAQEQPSGHDVESLSPSAQDAFDSWFERNGNKGDNRYERSKAAFTFGRGRALSLVNVLQPLVVNLSQEIARLQEQGGNKITENRLRRERNSLRQQLAELKYQGGDKATEDRLRRERNELREQVLRLRRNADEAFRGNPQTEDRLRRERNQYRNQVRELQEKVAVNKLNQQAAPETLDVPADTKLIRSVVEYELYERE